MRKRWTEDGTNPFPQLLAAVCLKNPRFNPPTWNQVATYISCGSDYILLFPHSPESKIDFVYIYILNNMPLIINCRINLQLREGFLADSNV